jgi:hypothetical protein
MLVEGLRIVQQLTSSWPVMQICGMHIGAPKPAFGVHQYLPFTPVHLFVVVIELVG